VKARFLFLNTGIAEDSAGAAGLKETNSNFHFLKV